MAFNTAAVERMKTSYETAMSRLHNMRKASERGIERAASVAFTGGTATLAGYVNEKWGKPPANDATGMKELTILGLPADMLGGGILLAGTMLGAFGKYDHTALSVGNGALAAFGYRFGAEWAKRHETATQAPKTAGQFGAGGFGPGYVSDMSAAGAQGRAQHFTYAP